MKANLPKLKVIVGGGTGFIGHNLCNSLRTSGHQVTLISRTPGQDRLTWSQLEKEGLPPSDAIVQIPGANIMEKSWTEQRKKEIYDSRVGTTKILVNAIARSSQPPKALICGSAVGYYPSSKTNVLEFDEYYKGGPAKTFSGELCAEWENTVWLDKRLDNVRKVSVRTGVVLGKDDGALASMLLPFKLGLGGPMGSGNQNLPWIHLQDIVGIFQHAVENNEVQGILNGTAPQYITNKEFAKALGKALNRPAVIPLPEFVLNLLFQERASMLTEGHKIIPKRTLESGYKFKFDNIDSALQDLVK